MPTVNLDKPLFMAPNGSIWFSERAWRWSKGESTMLEHACMSGPDDPFPAPGPEATGCDKRGAEDEYERLEVEVTEEMLKAGMQKYASMKEPHPFDETLKAIYRAMKGAER